MPDYVQGNGSTLCVLDGSGSMRYNRINEYTNCEDVARGMTLYFSERCSGQFKDTFITFSMRPQLVHIDPKNSLLAKLEILARYTEYANTQCICYKSNFFSNITVNITFNIAVLGICSNLNCIT